MSRAVGDGRAAKAPRSEPAAPTAAESGGVAAAGAAAAAASLELGALPDGPLAQILSALLPRDVLRANACCRSWRLGAERAELWRLVAVSRGVELPGALGGGSGRRTRLSANLKKAFFVGYVRMRKAELRMCDRRGWEIWMKLHKSDCLSLTKKAIAAHPSLPGHRIGFYAERTLAMLAAWRGRLKVLQHVRRHLLSAPQRPFAALPPLSAPAEAKAVGLCSWWRTAARTSTRRTTTASARC